MRFWRNWNKKRPEEARAQAEKLKARAEARKSVQGLLTPAQEQLRKELGLVPGGFEKTAEGKPKKQEKDPLTKRQRALLKELGLD